MTVTSISMWCEVRWLDHIGSTNSDVTEEARRGRAEGLVMATLEQQASHERMGRTWVTPSETSLTFSMLLESKPELPQWGWLLLLVGMAVYAAVDGLATESGRVRLKQPNDVLTDGCKMYGILNEYVRHQDGTRAVIGIGIDVSVGEDQLPIPTATSLRIAGFHEDPRELLESVLKHFQPLYEHWQDMGEVRDEYQRRYASIGTPLWIVVDAR